MGDHNEKTFRVIENINATIVQDYLSSITRRGYSVNTVATYNRILADYLAWLHVQQIHIFQITHGDIESFQVFLVAGPRGMPLSPGRRALYVSVLRSFYESAAKAGHINFEPADWLQYPIQPKRIRQDILTVDEMHDLLDTAAKKGGWQNVAIRLMLLSGLRVAEAAALLAEDVSLQQREIVIRQAKGNKHRMVFFDTQTKQHLSAYLNLRRKRLRVTRLPQHAPLLDHNGSPRNSDQIYGAVKRLAKRAGITKSISPHSLRRTFATRLLDSGVKGVNLKVVAELLGHSSLRTTAKYAQVDELSLARVYQSAHPAFVNGFTA